MYINLTAINNNSVLTLSINDAIYNEMSDIVDNFNNERETEDVIVKEYLVSQVKKNGRFFTTQKLSERSCREFKKWAEENNVNTLYDFYVEF